MSRAWTFQDCRQKQKLGDKAPWSVGWYTPEGKKRSRRLGSKSAATKYARKLEGQLAAGLYEDQSRMTWADCRKAIDSKILASMSPGTRDATRYALNNFERLVKPKYVRSIKTETIDEFIAKRREERGLKPGSKVSPATVNCDLRHIKMVLRIVHEWKHLPEVPKIRMVREPKKVPRYVTPEHFAAIYNACHVAKRPAPANFTTEEWWQALIVTAYMTGWRIGDLLGLYRDNVDLDAGVAILEADDTKGKRGEVVPLPEVVVEHLERLAGFDDMMFPVEQDRRVLWSEFERIQAEAGIHLTCHGKHEHTPSCHLYGFHDLRRAFATMNAERLTADALQALMRHQSYTTTQRYINMAQQLNGKAADLFVPDVLRTAEAG